MLLFAVLAVEPRLVNLILLVDLGTLVLQLPYLRGDLLQLRLVLDAELHLVGSLTFADLLHLLLQVFTPGLVFR